MKASSLRISVFMCLLLAMLHAALAFSLRYERSQWLNVPPSTGAGKLNAVFLGDNAMAYRSIAIMFQNLGNVGGRSENLENYNYTFLGEWFSDSLKLDSHSNAVPVLAAYYFSATENPEKLRNVVNYLATAGDSTEGQKWRWLAQAAYLARFKIHDKELALELASKLAHIKKPDMPGWARQMPAIILSDMGEKEAALGLLFEIIRTHGEELAPQEIFVMKEFMCRELIKPEDKEFHGFCEDLQGKLF